MRNFVQNGSTAHDSFDFKNVTFDNVSLNGNLTLNCSNNIAVLGTCTFARTNHWTANDFSGFSGCTFSSVSGNSTTLINVAGGVYNNLTGGNTFNNLTLSVFGNGQGMTLGNSTADTYNGNTTIISNGSNPIVLGASGANTFAGNLTLARTTGGGDFTIGNTSNNSTISGALLHDNSNPTATNTGLTINRLIQTNPINNGTFTNLEFVTLYGVQFLGDLNFTNVAGSLTVSTTVPSVFAANNNWKATDFVGFSGCTFSSTPGTGTTLNKGSAGSNNTLFGGNTFGNLTARITGSNSNTTLAFAGSLPDNYNGDTFVFIEGSSTLSGNITLAASGVNTFGGNITLGRTGGNGIITIGNTSNTSTMSGALLNSNSSPTTANVSLVINNLSQIGTSANGNFILNSLSIGGSTLGGNTSFAAVSLGNFSNNTFGTPLHSINLTKNGAGNDNLVGGNTFHNLTLNITGTGTLTMANTTGDTYYGNVSFGRTNGTLRIASNGQNNFHNNITLTSNSAANVNFGNGGGWLNIVGNTIQSYTANQVLNCGRLRMNTTGTLSLNSALNIDNECDFVNGIINPASSSQTLVFQASSSVSGASNNSHVNGAVRKVGTTAFTFPIGKAGEYTPIGIGTSASSSTFSAEYFKTNFPSLAPFQAPLVKVSYCEYWDLTRVSGTGTPLVTLSWNDPRSCGVSNMADLRVAHWTGSTWEDLGNSSTTGTTTSGTITSAIASSSYSPFTIGSTSADNALPLTLIDFRAETLGNGRVGLEWQTTDERNSSHFIIERKNIHQFDSVGMVMATGKSSNKYSFLDFDANVGHSYYRLKMVDTDGHFSYSKVVTVHTPPTVSANLKLYPNPTKNEIYISGDFSKASYYVIKNIYGVEVQSGLIQTNYTTRIDISNLSSGLYWFETGENLIRFVVE